MNRAEHILDVIGEEGAEVAQRVSKALRFGLSEVQPGQPLTNAQRIQEEVYDVIGAYGFAVNEGLLPPMNFDPKFIGEVVAQKSAKIEHFMAIGREQGALSDG